jgi:uncharacterized protein YpiB (UPF0302 family)
MNLLFKKNDIVKIINPNHSYFDETAEVIFFNQISKKYLLQFANGYKVEIDYYDLVKHLNDNEKKQLQIAHLDQMIDVALDLNDEIWFKTLILRRKTLAGK